MKKKRFFEDWANRCQSKYNGFEKWISDHIGKRNADQINVDLDAAVQEESLERVKNVLKRGPDVNKISGDTHLTALEQCFLIKNMEFSKQCASLLIEEGAVLDFKYGAIFDYQQKETPYFQELLLFYERQIERQKIDGLTGKPNETKRKRVTL